MNAAVQIDREALAELCRRWKIRELSIFGSALRDDFGPESDLDFLISFQPDSGWDLFDWVALRDELAELTGRDVDIVEKAGLRNPFRRREILAHREVMYAAG